jgi:hypothetical protein
VPTEPPSCMCRVHVCCRYLVREARAQCGPIDIIDRCNLTVLCEPGQEDTAEFLAQHKVSGAQGCCCVSSCSGCACGLRGPRYVTLHCLSWHSTRWVGHRGAVVHVGLAHGLLCGAVVGLRLGYTKHRAITEEGGVSRAMVRSTLVLSCVWSSSGVVPSELLSS